VKMAIENELDQDGQYYSYVVSRISMLQEAEVLIKECFPDIRIISKDESRLRNSVLGPWNGCLYLKMLMKSSRQRRD
jgi:transcription-repair coupling factor (superfamily II helicase)